MSIGRIVGLLVAVVMLVGGALLAFTGMGYLGSGETSTAWSVIGALLAGLGVALGISIVQNRGR